MAAYATYSYYTATYLGTTIASGDFARLVLRASAVIDQLTFNRAAAIITADDPEATVTAIEMATCAVAEEIQTQEANANSDGVTSERVGNYSVTYGSKSQSALTNQQKLSNAAKLYLGNTGLMFPGFAAGEYGGVVGNED